MGPLEIIFGVIAAIVVGAVFIAIYLRNSNHNYTIGSGLFKTSEYNLDKDEHVDSSDYNYYDDGLRK